MDDLDMYSKLTIIGPAIAYKLTNISIIIVVKNLQNYSEYISKTVDVSPLFLNVSTIIILYCNTHNISKRKGAY